MKRRLLSAFLAVMMVLTMAPVAFAADTSVDSYDKLVQAIASAADGDTITISGSGEIAIDAPLEITKSVTLTGGSIVPSENFSGSCLVKLETADATLTLGDIKLDAKQKGRVIVCTAGTLEINGATITNGKAADSFIGGVYMTNSSELYMTSGSITGNVNGNTAYTSDNYLQYASDLWIGANASGLVENGTVDNVFVNANSYSANAQGGFAQAGGKVTNLYVEYAGNYGADVLYGGGTLENLYISTTKGNGVCKKVTPVVGMKYKGGVTDDEAVTPEAKIGEVSYNTLQDAFDNAESGDTVTLLKNIKTSSVDAANAGLAISKSITLDLNDKTIISPDNMGNNKKNIAALTVKADTTIKATTGGIDTGKNGGYAINVLSGAKLTIDGGKYYGGSTAVQVQTGELTIKDGYFDAEAFSGSYGYNFIINCIDSAYKDDTAKVAIKGGYFAHFNPANNKAEGAGTNFVADGYISVTSDKSGYDYMVTKKTTVGTTDVTPDVAEPEVTASKDIPSEVTEAAKNIEAPDLATAANDIVKNIGEDTVSDLVHKSGYENPNLYVQTSLKVEAKAYDATAKTLTLEITPQYRIVASTAATADGIELGDNGNAKVVQGYQPLDITKPIEVTMELPTSFAVDNGAKLSIKHTKSNGTVEYYTGTVTEQSGKHLLTFTTNGFSPFVISVPAASIGENVYPTLQAAVDSVESGKTIKLGQAVAPDTKVTVAKTIKFEVATNEKTFAKENIVAGANTTVKVTGDARLYTYEFTYTKPSSGGSSGGSSSGKTTYKVTTSAVNNGGVNASPSSAEKGAAITITLSPDKGYKLDKLTVTDGSGKTVSTVKKSDTVYTFTMPASAVKVGVSYVKATETPSETKFNDVSANDWFASAVDYVTGKGMMNGTADNTFSPKANTTRGMVVTVLYRLENQPSTSAASFTDVASGAYYANAVAWANANGIVSGYGSGKFGPNDKVTREQLAAILYRYAQYKKYDVSVGEDTNILSYDDAQSISTYAIPAIQWACGAGVVTGKSGSKLDPKGNATRAEVAAMLMRFCENVK